jgi:hypothetical protein
MALWRFAKHYGTYREGIALAVSSAQILVAIVLVVVALAGSPRARATEASITPVS